MPQAGEAQSVEARSMGRAAERAEGGALRAVIGGPRKGLEPLPRAKAARDENFPVGSRLIRRDLRPHVARLYAFARAADDVADAPHLGAADKLARLDAFEAALDGAPGPEPARALRESLRETGVSDRHARDLLAAFRRDATEGRCADWAALAGYCALSAHPVGRHVLDLHGEAPRARPASDALCAALQVLNHLQDLGADRRALDRVYLPLDWMAEAGARIEDLDAERASRPLRRVIDRALDGCDAWLDRAGALPRLVRSPRLAGECAAILRLARRLAARLRRSDPLAARVALSKADFAVAAAFGAAFALRRAARR